MAKQKKIDDNEKIVLEEQSKARNAEIQEKKRKRTEKKQMTQ